MAAPPVQIEDAIKDPAVKAADDEARAERAKLMSFTYGKYFIVTTVIAYVGYIFTWLMRHVRDAWYPQPHYFHGIFGIMWGMTLCVQIFSGATRGDVRRKIHRVVGSLVGPVVFYTLMISGVPIVASGLMAKNGYYEDDVDAHDVWHGYILLSMAVFDTVAFTIAYVAAKYKHYAMHKDMIGFVVLSFGDAGIYRLIAIFLHFAFPCGMPEIAKNKEVVAHVITRFLLVLIIIPVFTKHKRWNNLNIAMVVTLALLEIPVMIRVRGDGLCANY